MKSVQERERHGLEYESAYSKSLAMETFTLFKGTNDFQFQIIGYQVHWWRPDLMAPKQGCNNLPFTL